MIMHIYMVERQTQQQTIREMIASQDYLVIDNIIIDNQNNKYIKIDNNSARCSLIQLLSSEEVSSLQEFQTRIQKIVNEKGVSCKYKYNNQNYLCLAQPREQLGVWSDNGVIWHQLTVPNFIKPTDIVVLGPDKDPSEFSFDDEEYQKLWFENIKWLLCRRKPFPTAFYLGFVLAYSKFEYDRSGGAAFTARYPYHQIDCHCGIIEMGVPQLTDEQFKKYVLPAIKGKPQYGVLDFTFSMFSGSQLTKAYYHYIIPFWDKYFAKK